MNLSNTLFVSFSDLMFTIESYFRSNTGFAEREVETTAISIHNAYFLVSSLHGVRFSGLSDKLLMVLDPDHRPIDLTYFIFRFIIFAATVEIRALTSSLSLEFSLQLFQSLSTLPLIAVSQRHQYIPHKLQHLQNLWRLSALNSGFFR